MQTSARCLLLFRERPCSIHEMLFLISKKCMAPPACTARALRAMRPAVLKSCLGACEGFPGGLPLLQSLKSWRFSA